MSTQRDNRRVFPRSNRLWRPYAAAGIMLGGGMILTGVVTWHLQTQAREVDQARFDRLVRQNAQALHDRVEKYQLALVSLAEYAAARPTMSAPEWRFRLRLLAPEERYPGLLEIGLAQVAVRETRPAVSHPEAQTGDRAAAETNALHLLHGWVRPPTAFDGISRQFLEDEETLAAARSALHTGLPVARYGQELSAEVDGNPARGFTIFVPAFEPGATSPGPKLVAGAEADPRPGRAVCARGVVFGSIELNLLIENLFGIAPRQVECDLFSGAPPSTGNWLNMRRDSPLTLQPGFRPYLHTNLVLQFPWSHWAAIFHTTPLFERESPRDRPRIAAVMGLTLSALISALLFIQIRARLRQEDIAAELRAACDDLQQVQNERERVGRDLHDGAIQSLYGLQLSLGHFERLLAPWNTSADGDSTGRARDPAAARELLGRCRTAVDALIAELRTFIVQRVPEENPTDPVANAGAALQQLVHRFQSAAAVPIELVLKDAPPAPVTLSQQLHLRQIAQEAISNSLRHARPKHIRVELHRHNQHLHLRVADDGAGFDVGKPHSGQGLANMQARAAQLGGHLNVESRPGRGTQVTLRIPIAAEPVTTHGQDA